MTKKIAVFAVLLMILAGLAAAQSASTFTFGGLPDPFSANQSRCTNITSWNGISATDPANPYPQNMGGICLAIYPANYTQMSIPWQLGFPNNGYMQNCTTVWQPLVNNEDGTATQAFTANGCYDGANTTITATVNYRSVSHTYCGRTGCHTFHQWQVISGSGTVSNQ